MTSRFKSGDMLFVPENFTIFDFDNLCFGKKKNSLVVPLFATLRAIKRKEGSKITTHLHLKNGVATEAEFQSLLNKSYEPTQSDIYQELAWRFVRRHKILSAFSYLIQKCLSIRFRLHHRIQIQIPAPDMCCGWLQAEPHHRISSTITVLNARNINEVYYHRNEQIRKLKRKKMQPTGLLLVQWILQTELFKLIQVKENETKPTRTEIRSIAAKQAWLRRQQSNSAELQ